MELLKEKLLFFDWWDCRPDGLPLAGCFFDHLHTAGRLSPDVRQGEGVSAKKGKREGLREKNRGRRVFIFVGEAVSVNGLEVLELVPSLKETFEISSSLLLCFLRKIQWCHQLDSQMAALRKDGSRHDNGFILIACDQ